MKNKDDAIALLRDYCDKVRKLRDFERQCATTIGTNPESPLNANLFLLVEPMGKVVEELISDSCADWLSWFIWDNDFGERGMSVSVDGVSKEIRTVEDLYWVLVESRGIAR